MCRGLFHKPPALACHASIDMKISVITYNPGIDRIIYLPTPAQLGTLNRAERVVVSQGSKGANVAIVLRRLGHMPAYFAFSGGASGASAQSFTDRDGVDGRFIPTASGVRTNIKIIDSDGCCTEFNERGGPVTAAELAALENAVEDYAPELAVLGGSLPQGAGVDTYARMVHRLGKRGCRVAVDADGEALLCALEQRPELIKPNVRELAGIIGVPEAQLYEPAALEHALREVRGRYGCDVVCTLDSRGAAVLDATGFFRVDAQKVTLRGFSGAGDTFLAAYLHSRLLCGHSTHHALAFANAAAAAKICLPGSQLPSREQLELIS